MRIAKNFALYALPAYTPAFTQTTPSDSPSYESMLDRLKGGDRSVDLRKLRLVYPDSATYAKAKDTSDEKKKMTAALNAKNFQEAVQNAEVALASNYIDIDAHFAEFVADRELKETEKAEFHKFVTQGLLSSITASRDGKTPESAFQVIDVHEEYVLLRFMGVGLPQSQSWIHKNGHAYDEIKFKDPASGGQPVMYFNVDVPAKHGR